MKLTVVLVAIVGYSALLLTNAAPQKTGQPARPNPSPTATPARQQTPPAAPSPTASPAPTGTPAMCPCPTTTGTPAAPGTPAAAPAPATPTPSPTPAPAGPVTTGAASTPAAAAGGAADPCEGKKLPSGIPLCDHKQPETTELSVDALQGTDYNPAPPERRVGRVAFNHTTHARDNYSIDGKKVIGCVECHHTDQPAAGLPAGGVLKTGLRNAVLTKETFSASVPPVLSCRACHAQQDKKPPVCADPQQAARYAFCPNNPQASYSEEGDVEINNTQAYHRNCKDCHEKAVAEHRKPGALPFIKAAPPTACAGCHKPRT